MSRQRAQRFEEAVSSGFRRVRQYSIAKILPGHHTLDIPVSLIGEMACGWTRLEEAGQLYRGAGLFEFGDFQIRL